MVVATKAQFFNLHNSMGQDLQTLRTNGWVSILPKPAVPGHVVGAYNGGLLLAKADTLRSITLSWWKDNQLIPVAKRPTEEGDSFHLVAQAKGDSLYLVGKYKDETGRNLHHVALFDGEKLQPLGDGLPFDTVLGAVLLVTNDMVYVAGSFRNQGCRTIRCLLGYDGRCWQLLHTNEKVQFGYRYGTTKTDLYRSGQQAATFEYFRSPEHKKEPFPAESLPFVQRWTGQDWQTIWEGKTGKISAFATQGNELWATLAHGTDANLLRIKKDHCEVVSRTPLPKAGRGKINPFKGLWIYRDTPVVLVGFPKNMENYHRRLAYWKPDGWRWLGPPELKDPKRVVPLADRLWIVTMRSPGDLYSGPTINSWWLGDLPPGPVIETEDLAKLEQWKTVCMAADQQDRPDLELPWPRGLEKPNKEDCRSAGSRPGWFLSEWPDSLPVDQVIQIRDDNVLVLDPRQQTNLQFCFDWPEDTDGQIRFEYRTLNPDGWRIPEIRTTYSSWSQHPKLAEVPYPPFFGYSKSNFFFPQDERWHKLAIPFRSRERSRHCKIIYSAGQAAGQFSRLEIRNIRIKKKKNNPLETFKEIRKQLRNYSWPKDAEEMLEGFLD